MKMKLTHIGHFSDKHSQRHTAPRRSDFFSKQNQVSNVFRVQSRKKKKLATRKIISLYPSPTDSKKTRSPPLPEPDWCCWWVLSVSQFPQPQQPISRLGRTVFPKNDPNKRSVPGRFRRAVNTSIYGEKKKNFTRKGQTAWPRGED